MSHSAPLPKFYDFESTAASSPESSTRAERDESLDDITMEVTAMWTWPRHPNSKTVASCARRCRRRRRLRLGPHVSTSVVSSRLSQPHSLSIPKSLGEPSSDSHSLLPHNQPKPLDSSPFRWMSLAPPPPECSKSARDNIDCAGSHPDASDLADHDACGSAMPRSSPLLATPPEEDVSRAAFVDSVAAKSHCAQSLVAASGRAGPRRSEMAKASRDLPHIASWRTSVPYSVRHRRHVLHQDSSLLHRSLGS